MVNPKVFFIVSETVNIHLLSILANILFTVTKNSVYLVLGSCEPRLSYMQSIVEKT